MDSTWDCIVVGGGAAGLSAALVLGRARRRTLVLDAGGQSNRPTDGIGGLLGHDQRPPAEFYAAARAELAAYPALELRSATVAGARRVDADVAAPGPAVATSSPAVAAPGPAVATSSPAVATPGPAVAAPSPAAPAPAPAAADAGFAVTLGDGTTEVARRLLLATGMDYTYPQLPGLAERWGRSVFHCPFCHGWEHHGEPLAVIGTDMHRPLLLRAWSDDITLLTNGEELPGDAARQLAAAGIKRDDRPISHVTGPDADTLAAVVFSDGGELACSGLLPPIQLRQRTDLATQLGADLADPNPMVVDAVKVDATFRTSVPGLFAAGDMTGAMPSVANAIAAGHAAGAMVVGDLFVPQH